MHHDVIIIGAGPAGIMLGIMLQQKGHSVIIIDKCFFPRNKLCGGLLTKRSQTFLKSIIGDTNDLFKGIQAKQIDHINVVTNNDMIQYKKRRNPFLIVNRKNFDNAMVCHYKSLGGVIYEGCHIREAEYNKNRLELSDGRILSFRFLIGADGVYSKIRKFVDPHYKANGLCFESDIDDENLSLSKDTMYLFYGLYKYGYGWVFPRNGDFAVGIGGTIDVKKQISQLDSITGLLGISTKFKSLHFPFGKFVRHPIKENVL